MGRGLHPGGTLLAFGCQEVMEVSRSLAGPGQGEGEGDGQALKGETRWRVEAQASLCESAPDRLSSATRTTSAGIEGAHPEVS